MNYPFHEILHKTGKYWSGKCLKHVPVISTCHITKEDGRYCLEKLWPVIDIYSDGAGFMVRVPDDKDCQSSCSEYSYPFTCLLEAFRERGYRWIILDRDGDKVNGLPTFEW